MLKSGIYALTCIATGQSYVGSAVSLKHRVHRHILNLKNGRRKNKPLQDCFNKVGLDGFEVKFLEECPIPALLNRERYWVRKLGALETGFNVDQLGSNGYLTHGMTHSRTFKSWESMLQRCTNPNAPDYPRYGGAGITVCERWRKFENFYADMGERPEGTTIDRSPKKAGNYEPKNCRWATPGEQQRNIKSNLYLTIDGVRRFLVDVADEKGIPRDLLRRRFHAGMVGDELFAPSYSRYKGDGTGVKRKRVETRHNLHRFEYNGKKLTITELAEETGIPRSRLTQRLLRDHLTVEEALCEGPRKKGKEGPRKGRTMITAFGKTQSLSRWAAEYHMALSTLKNRIIRAQMAPEVALQQQRRNLA